MKKSLRIGWYGTRDSVVKHEPVALRSGLISATPPKVTVTFCECLRSARHCAKRLYALPHCARFKGEGKEGSQGYELAQGSYPENVTRVLILTHKLY